jgi:hypothetical protein
LRPPTMATSPSAVKDLLCIRLLMRPRSAISRASGVSAGSRG